MINFGFDIRNDIFEIRNLELGDRIKVELRIRPPYCFFFFLRTLYMHIMAGRCRRCDKSLCVKIFESNLRPTEKTTQMCPSSISEIVFEVLTEIIYGADRRIDASK